MVVRCAYYISWQADDVHYFEQGKVILVRKSDQPYKILIKDLKNPGKILLTLTKDICKILIKSLKILKKKK